MGETLKTTQCFIGNGTSVHPRATYVKHLSQQKIGGMLDYNGYILWMIVAICPI
jgi:hypothetical protein